MIDARDGTINCSLLGAEQRSDGNESARVEPPRAATAADAPAQHRMRAVRNRSPCSIGRLASSPALWAFALVHVFALKGVVQIGFGVQSRALLLCLATYLVRMLGITVGYHRYFSHRSFKTSRPFQFVLAWLGASSCQKGVLWWASWHRHHHQHADSEEDAHSPVHLGFWWSHFGWFLLSDAHTEVLASLVPDLMQYPELVWLEKWHLVPGAVLALACYWLFGGYQAFVYGFLVSTVALWHATFTINSLSHIYGSRRFICEFRGDCNARNNLWLALITLGEGWHNNHHSFMGSARQGFYWYEFDPSYWLIRLLALLRVVKKVREPPLEQLERKRLPAECRRWDICSCVLRQFCTETPPGSAHLPRVGRNACQGSESDTLADALHVLKAATEWKAPVAPELPQIIGMSWPEHAH
jgi:stearoyl-CoA desaturase (delta-9 desaturase)